MLRMPDWEPLRPSQFWPSPKEMRRKIVSQINSEELLAIITECSSYPDEREEAAQRFKRLTSDSNGGMRE